MRNDIKPVIPHRQDTPAGGARGAHRGGGAGRDAAHLGDGGAAAGADFDREHGSPVRRERGDGVDPAGPKRSSVYGSMGTGGAVTDPSGTTGPVSRSNDRQSTTTGKLRDRDLERSARQGEAPDINALDIATGTRTLSVPLFMSAAAIAMALLLLFAWWSWPKEPLLPDDGTARVGQRSVPGEQSAP